MLSFCIPTYNRGDVIEETIASIEKVGLANYEIVVYDGASTDNTQHVLDQISKRNKSVRYIRASKNSGVDADMASCVAESKGDYCWLLSSDDVLIPVAAAEFINFVYKFKRDIYLTDFTYCSRDLKPLKKSNIILSNANHCFFNTKNSEELRRYYRSGTSNNILFCYMSIIVFRTEKWQSVKHAPALQFAGYAHALKLNQIVADGCDVAVFRKESVLNRGDNDCFEKLGIEKRYLLDFVGYRNIANHIFGSENEKKTLFLQLIQKEHKWYRIVKFRSAVPKRSWQEYIGLLVEVGYNKNLLKMCGFIGGFPWLVISLVKLKKFVKNFILPNFYFSRS
jgi:abequosyltransferase